MATPYLYLSRMTGTISMKHMLCPVFTIFLLVGCLQTDPYTSPNEKKSVVVDDDNEGIVLKEEEVTNKAKETWISLFDGKTLTNWTVPVYGGDGIVEIDEGHIVIGRGELMTGLRYDKEFPKIDYEIRYEAKRTEGYDFFGACTFPVNESFCTLVNGGWGGGLTGLSSIDGYDASENSTSTYCDYKSNTWYRLRILVTDEKIQVWLTGQDKEENWETEESVVEFEREERSLSTRFEMDKYKPLGFSTWGTGAQLRNIEYRKIDR